MRVEKTSIDGAVSIELPYFGDERGYFLEAYRRDRYAACGLDADFVQDNLSLSRRGVLRGMHYQVSRPQGHLVQVVRGRIFDVGVDLRPDSPTFACWYGATLDANSPRQLFFPAGVAHGFCVLSDEAQIHYKCTDYYVPGDEGGVCWDDPTVAIEWPIRDPIVNDRDRAFPSLTDIESGRLPYADRSRTQGSERSGLKVPSQEEFSR